MVRSFSAPAPVTTTPKITSMSERAFSASYDSTTRAISAAVCLLLMVVAWVVHMVFIALLFPLLIGLAYAYSPRGYAISGGAIVVQRLIGNIRVPLAEIREMRAGPGKISRAG